MTGELPLLSSRAGSPSLAEAYCALRTNLSFLAGDAVKTIMVTSALPREGKSTVAANLALACANADKQVLLVDSDLRNPTQHINFALENTAGLAQVIQHGNERDLLVRSIQPRLDVLTSGPLPANPPDYLASDMMPALLGFLREHYDLVILDSPPVLLVADAVALGQWVDGVLFVIKAANTRPDQANKAIKQLRRANQNLLGVVLNAVDAGKAFERYERNFGVHGGGEPPQPADPAEPSSSAGAR